MDNFRDREESPFFDALEHVGLESDFISNFKDREYDVWIKHPQSVRDRRRKFMRWMALFTDEVEREISVDINGNGEEGLLEEDRYRITDNSGAVPRVSTIDSEPSSRCTSVSGWNSDEFELPHGVDLSESRNGNESSSEDGLSENKRLGPSRVKGSYQFPSSCEIENACEFSWSAQIPEHEVDYNGATPRMMNRLMDRWFNKLRSMTCMISSHVKDDTVESNRSCQVQGNEIQRVKVCHRRRRLKEFSALFTGQDIQAHEGAIVAMKFSHDGQYLASAGEDKLVKVWQVVEDEGTSVDFTRADPACIYLYQHPESQPATKQNEIDKSKSLKRTQDAACVVSPRKIFRILDTPLHVFRGHTGEILDLSWSKSNSLLSSSTDKTVRLWRIGSDQCLKVFWHCDYVTCIQFNPVNNEYFISGSLDGMVRIWATNCCQVVNWTETNHIITAVSYRPDGQGGIFGSITGTCHFFSITDNRLQLETQMCLTTQKKPLSCKRITGFQFLVQDPSKVLVICADSQVRIINEKGVIARYKGLRNAGNHVSASLTSDGKHIISASEDSNVYIWNYVGQEDRHFFHPKSITSFEFFSSDASVVAPWPGLKTENSENRLRSRNLLDSINSLPLYTSTRFSSSQDFFFDSTSPKGSATWPEEKLPASKPGALASSLSASEYKLFKASCQSLSSSHAWGLVIVTAGWDGRIRSFHNYGLPTPL